MADAVSAPVAVILVRGLRFVPSDPMIQTFEVTLILTLSLPSRARLEIKTIVPDWLMGVGVGEGEDW